MVPPQPRASSSGWAATTSTCCVMSLVSRFGAFRPDDYACPHVLAAEHCLGKLQAQRRCLDESRRISLRVEHSNEVIHLCQLREPANVAIRRLAPLELHDFALL